MPDFEPNTEPINENVRGIICAESMKKIDSDMLTIAKKAAKECAKVLEDAITEGIKTKEEIFSTLYFPILPLKTPPTFTTLYDYYTDKYITPIVDKYLNENKELFKVLLENKHSNINDLVGKIREEIAKFDNGAEQSDDITILVLKFNI